MSDFGFLERSRMATALLDKESQDSAEERLCLCDGWECQLYWPQS